MEGGRVWCEEMANPSQGQTAPADCYKLWHQPWLLLQCYAPCLTEIVSSQVLIFLQMKVLVAELNLSWIQVHQSPVRAWVGRPITSNFLLGVGKVVFFVCVLLGYRQKLDSLLC